MDENKIVLLCAPGEDTSILIARIAAELPHVEVLVEEVSASADPLGLDRSGPPDIHEMLLGLSEKLPAEVADVKPHRFKGGNAHIRGFFQK